MGVEIQRNDAVSPVVEGESNVSYGDFCDESGRLLQDLTQLGDNADDPEVSKIVDDFQDTVEVVNTGFKLDEISKEVKKRLDWDKKDIISNSFREAIGKDLLDSINNNSVPLESRPIDKSYKDKREIMVGKEKFKASRLIGLRKQFEKGEIDELILFKHGTEHKVFVRQIVGSCSICCINDIEYSDTEEYRIFKENPENQFDPQKHISRSSAPQFKGVENEAPFEKFLLIDNKTRKTFDFHEVLPPGAKIIISSSREGFPASHGWNRITKIMSVIFPISSVFDVIVPFHEIGHHVENLSNDELTPREIEEMWDNLGLDGNDDIEESMPIIEKKSKELQIGIEFASSVWGLSIIRILEQSGISLGITAKAKRDILRGALSAYEKSK